MQPLAWTAADRRSSNDYGARQTRAIDAGEPSGDRAVASGETMTKLNLNASAAIAVVLGFAQAYFLMLCWGYIGAYSPVLGWLLDLGLRDASLRAVLYPIDFATTVALSAPAALLLVRLRPAKLLLFLALAVVPPFIWQHYHLIGDSVLAEFWPAFLFGWVQELVALPVAALLIRWRSGPTAPDSVLQDARA